MKIPEPIITPTTTITESNRPRPRAKEGSDGGAGGVASGALVAINILVILMMPESAVNLLQRFVPRRQMSAWRQDGCVESMLARMKRLDQWIIYTRLYLRVELIFGQLG
jgi:hypothetical protein